MLRHARRILPIVALLLVAGLLSTWPMATDPAELSLAGRGNNDYWFNTYVVFWGAHALISAPLELHHTNMFWPERHTFAYSDMELAHSLLVLPVIAATDNPVLVNNLLLLLSIVIGGTGAWALARHVTGSGAAGLVAALVFVFNDAHFTRYLAIQFFGDHWLPWLALAVLLWLESLRPRWALAAALLYVLHALTGSHAAVFGAVVVGVLVLVHLVRARLWRRPGLLPGLAILTLVPLLLLGPVFYPYLLLQERMAAERGDSAEVLYAGSAGPRDLLTGASRFHGWMDDNLGWPSAVLGGRLGAHLFPGWIPLLLALALLLPGRDPDRRDEPAPGDPVAWGVLLAVCLLLALGPAALLYRVLSLLPGIRLIRVPSRFVLPGLLALTMLAAHGVRRLLVRAGPRASAALVAATVALFALESVFAPVPTARLDLGPDRVSSWLAEQPGEFAVLELPVDVDNLTAHVRQARQSIHHWKRLLVGYSGWRPPEVRRRLLRIQRRFPAPAVLDELASLEVRYLVVVERRVPAALLERMRQSPRLLRAADLDGVSIWELDGDMARRGRGEDARG